MTEAEWLTSDDPQKMLTQIRGRGSERKWRFVACECLRCLQGLAFDFDITEILGVAERLAEGDAPEDALGEARATVTYWHDIAQNSDGYVAAVADAALQDDPQAGAFSALQNAEYFSHEAFGYGIGYHYAGRAREIFGNPFQPVAFDPEWKSDTAVSLAKQMYESRDFSTMPILADALQDAGCDNDDILNHCRDANATHVRGCWVVDLVLGKS
jgi:hypothetical protein